MSPVLMIVAILLGVVVAGAAIGLFGVLLFNLIRVIGRLLAHVFGTIGAWIVDVLRAVGAVVVAIIFVPLVVLSVVIGRWSAASHYGRALSSEIKTCGLCLYRVVIGHPLKLIGLSAVTEGLERRLPLAMAEAPGRDTPKGRAAMFDGYEIVGSLPGGGSGGKLYVAEPDVMKSAALAKRGHPDLDQVVIKSFSLTDGSSLPQIVRESRALDAARRLGLVLEHEMSPERFYYVMKYVPGESLARVTQRLHAESAPSQPPGLDNRRLREALGYIMDLVRSLDAYHVGGLWHKDVKPDNIIIDPADRGGQPRAHLVDFGLVTPLRSGMTLTTHGTEYFRDPELVRQALRGVKVHQIDGARFDVYAAGAVAYSVIENSFPAHGGLSNVSKRCPEALRWIIRRAMTDYDKRYPSAKSMLEDLAVVINASDPFTVKPVDLPSMGGAVAEEPPVPAADPDVLSVGFTPVAAPAQPERAPAAEAEPAAAAERARPAGPPKIEVAGWWSGKYRRAEDTPKAEPAPVRPRDAAKRRAPRGDRASAAEQVKRARARVAERRARAQARVASHRRSAKRSRGPAVLNAGVLLAVFLAAGAGLGLVAATLLSDRGSMVSIAVPGAGADRLDDAAARTHEKIAGLVHADEHPFEGVVTLVASPTALPKEISQQIKPPLRRLHRAGMGVYGRIEMPRPETQDHAELRGVGDAIAEAAAGVSRTLSDRPELISGALQALIAGSEVDGLIWIEPNLTEPDTSGMWLVSKDKVWRTSVGAADSAIDAFVAATTHVDWTGMAQMPQDERDAWEQDAAAEIDLEGRRVMLLSDFRPPLSDELRTSIAGAVEFLESAGAEVTGDLTQVGDGVSEEEIIAIAELRRLRGARPLDAGDLAEDLQNAVDEGIGADLIVWIAPQADGSGNRILMISDRGGILTNTVQSLTEVISINLTVRPEILGILGSTEWGGRIAVPGRAVARH